MRPCICYCEKLARDDMHLVNDLLFLIGLGGGGGIMISVSSVRTGGRRRALAAAVAAGQGQLPAGGAAAGAGAATRQSRWQRWRPAGTVSCSGVCVVWCDVGLV